MCQGACAPGMCQLNGSHKPVHGKLQGPGSNLPSPAEPRSNYTHPAPYLHPNTDKFTQVQQVVQVVACPDFQGNALTPASGMPSSYIEGLYDRGLRLRWLVVARGAQNKAAAAMLNRRIGIHVYSNCDIMECTHTYIYINT